MTEADRLLLALTAEYARLCDLFCLKPHRHKIYREVTNYLKSKGILK